MTLRMNLILLLGLLTSLPGFAADASADSAAANDKSLVSVRHSNEKLLMPGEFDGVRGDGDLGHRVSRGETGQPALEPFGRHLDALHVGHGAQRSVPGTLITEWIWPSLAAEDGGSR